MKNLFLILVLLIGSLSVTSCVNEDAETTELYETENTAAIDPDDVEAPGDRDENGGPE